MPARTTELFAAAGAAGAAMDQLRQHRARRDALVRDLARPPPPAGRANRARTSIDLAEELAIVAVDRGDRAALPARTIAQCVARRCRRTASSVATGPNTSCSCTVVAARESSASRSTTGTKKPLPAGTPSGSSLSGSPHATRVSPRSLRDAREHVALLGRGCHGSHAHLVEGGVADFDRRERPPRAARAHARARSRARSRGGWPYTSGQSSGSCRACTSRTNVVQRGVVGARRASTAAFKLSASTFTRTP